MEFSKLEIFWIFRIEHFWSLPNWKFKKKIRLEIFEILQLEKFFNFAGRKFLKFSKFHIFLTFRIENLKLFKLDFFGIRQIGNFRNFWIRNFSNYKINKIFRIFQKFLEFFYEFSNSGNQNLAPKVGKFRNLEWLIFRNFEISNKKITKVEIFFFYFRIFNFFICFDYSNNKSV